MRKLLLAMLFGASANAAVIPPDSEVLQRLSQAREISPPLAEKIRLLNWNILKGEKGELWSKDMQRFAVDRNLVLLQEGHQTPLVKRALEAIPGLSFVMANSFLHRGAMTGVISGFSTEASSISFRRSPSFEPGLNTPKMTMLLQFPLGDGRVLLVANLHGLNFVGPDKFQAQLQDVGAQLAVHSGPILFAGDFNTWNEGRLAMLNELVKKLGMEELAFEGVSQKAGLDHVFQRGCVVERAWIVEKVASSDHDPQFADLNCRGSEAKP